jgi:hypothetical protein
VVDLDRDHLTANVGILHRFFCNARVFLTPEFDDADVLAETGLGSDRREGTECSEKVV